MSFSVSLNVSFAVCFEQRLQMRRFETTASAAHRKRRSQLAISVRQAPMAIEVLKPNRAGPFSMT